jgi:hypothetical protein
MEKSTHTTTALAIFFVATAVVLIGGLAIVDLVNFAFAQQAGTLVCHEGRTMEVNFHAVPSHLKHGDLLGSCII